MALFGAAALTAAILTGSPAVSAPGGDASLTVAPNHGLPTAVFVAQYRVLLPGTQQGPRLGCPAVQFAWDGLPLGGPQRSARQNGNVCVATLRARPPARDRAAGAHRVEVPGMLGRNAQTVAYTVQGAASPTPTAGRPTPTRGATTGAAQGPTEPALFAPSGLGDPIVPLSSGPALGLAAPAGKSGGSAGPWIMVVGAVLVLGGVGILGLLIYRSRRGGPDPQPDPDYGFDPEIGGLYD